MYIKKKLKILKKIKEINTFPKITQQIKDGG